MKVLGVYGGSFDPPHLGHLLTATWVLGAGHVDELAIFPSAHHPLGKRPSASFEARMAMCRATFSDLPGASVDGLEAELGGEGYTLDLLRALAQREPGCALHLVVGEDILEQTDRWHAWDEICRLAPPVIIGRQGADSRLEDADALRMPDVSSTELRARLREVRSVRGLVHRRVLDVLARNNPYPDGLGAEEGR